MEKESCNCFTCRHRDEPRVVAGYLQGYIDASDWFINWAEKNKIKLGSIADDDLGGIYAQMKCNRDESGCLLEDFPDLENKKVKINEFITNPGDCESIMAYSFKQTQEIYKENQRLKQQIDREIRESRYLLNRLWLISKHLHKESGTSNETLIGYIEKLLKEFDYNPPTQNNESKVISKTFTINN